MSEFKTKMDRYLHLTKQRAVYRELLSFLSEYTASDTRAAQKTIIEKEGSLVINVDVGTVEQVIEELTRTMEGLTAEREELG